MCVCLCACRVVCCACVLKWLCVCVENVCGVCVESVCVWDVRFVFWCCGVLLCVLCVLCVWRGMARGGTTARKRREQTHGDVLNLHTGRREVVVGGGGFSSLSRPFLSSVVLFIRSLSLSRLFLSSLLSQQR